MALKFILSVAAVFVTFSLEPCFGNTPVTLDNDLFLDFTCPAPPKTSSFETFLKHEKFHTFNRQPLPSAAGEFPIDINIFAYDARRWRLYLDGPETIGAGKEIYNLVVESPPPTQHDKELEDKIVAFVGQAMNCKITFETRGENPASMRWFFDITFKQMTDEEAAAICNKEMVVYDAKKCIPQKAN